MIWKLNHLEVINEVYHRFTPMFYLWHSYADVRVSNADVNSRGMARNVKHIYFILAKDER